MAQLMSEAVFRLAYDGEAVRDGEMDVADLAPALLGLAQLLKAAGRVVEGDDAEISVRVKTTRDACFEVWLTLAVQNGKIAWAFLKSSDGQAALGLLGLLGFVGLDGKTVAGGAVGVVRWLKGRRPQRVSVGGDTVRLEVDGDTIEVPDAVARLALDPAVRSALEKVVAEPLEKDGITSVSLGDASTGQTIDKEEAAYFRAMPGGASDEFTSRFTKAFSIVTLSFKPGQKWRLNDGHSNPLVTVSDADFQAKVDAGLESFAKGDILVCEVVERAARTASGFKSEYEIVKVLEHRKVQPLTSMFDDASPEAS
jgi:hypothetical protein